MIRGVVRNVPRVRRGERSTFRLTFISDRNLSDYYPDLYRRILRTSFHNYVQAKRRIKLYNALEPSALPRSRPAIFPIVIGRSFLRKENFISAERCAPNEALSSDDLRDDDEGMPRRVSIEEKIDSSRLSTRCDAGEARDVLAQCAIITQPLYLSQS